MLVRPWQAKDHTGVRRKRALIRDRTPGIHPPIVDYRFAGFSITPKWAAHRDFGAPLMRRFTLLTALVCVVVSAGCEKKEAAPRSYEYAVYEWKHAGSPIRMIDSREGFCYLVSVKGLNNSGAEHARVYIGEDGFWYLDGHTFDGKGFLELKAMSVKFK
jgi:hypothetical protein